WLTVRLIRWNNRRYNRRIQTSPRTAQRHGKHITERNDYDHQRRARGYGAPYESIDLVAVFNHYGWQCQLCGGQIDPDARHPDPGMPSLDHIVPLSYVRSPGHVYGNVQASHLRCNLRKGDRY